MPLPTPSGESENEFISRCMSEISGEYDQDQALAICYSQWRGKSKMNIEHKSIAVELKAEEPGSFVARIATLNVRDKDNDITLPGAFPEGKTVLVSAYMHGSWSGRLPVGKATIHEVGNEALAYGQFNLAMSEGRDTYEAVKFAPELQEWSYGFYPTEAEDGEGENAGARILKKVDVKEISPVLVGAGVDTLTLAIKSETKGAISYASAHSNGTPKDPEDAEWDAGREVREAEVSDLHIMCAFVNSEADSENKTSYKLPHHRASGKHNVVWKGVAAAMAALLGARGGVSVPDSAKSGIYAHLKKHYSEFDKEVPDLRFNTEGMSYADQAETVLATVNDLVIRTKSLADLRREEGRNFSAQNRNRIKSLLDSLVKVASDLEKVLETTEPEDEKALLQAEFLLRKIKIELSEVC